MLRARTRSERRLHDVLQQGVRSQLTAHYAHMPEHVRLAHAVIQKQPEYSFLESTAYSSTHRVAPVGTQEKREQRYVPPRGWWCRLVSGALLSVILVAGLVLMLWMPWALATQPHLPPPPSTPSASTAGAASAAASRAPTASTA